MMVLIPRELEDLTKLIRTLDSLDLHEISLGDFDVFDSNGDKIGQITAESGDFQLLLSIAEEEN